MPGNKREILYFWNVVSALQAGLRDGVTGDALSELYDDVEGVAVSTDDAVLRARAAALLDARDQNVDQNITSEPFHDDLAALICIAGPTSTVGCDLPGLTAIYHR